MEQSPWGANSHSASREILHFLRNPKVHDRVHNSPPPIPMLSDESSQQLPKPGSLRRILKLSLHLCLGLPFRFFDGKFIRILNLPNACYMPSPSHPPWFDHPKSIWWGVQVMRFLTMQSSPTSSDFLPRRSEHSLQHLFPSTLNLSSKLRRLEICNNSS
jgi:hypothetical protein